MTGPRPRPATSPPVSPYAGRPWLASYPPGVPQDYDAPSVPLTAVLDEAAAQAPDAVALGFLGTRLTYRQLRDEVDRFAAALAGLGIGKGDRVALVLPNCPQNVIAMFATLRLGAVVVQHNPLYTEAELRHQLADCGATVVVCLDRVYATVAAVRAATALQHVVVTSLADYLPTAARVTLRLPGARSRRARAALTAVLPPGAPVKDFRTLLKAAGRPADQTPVDPETDLALLQYTGGTTGVSRGAMLTHTNLVANAHMNRLWDVAATPGKEITLGVLPLFHAYGLTVALTTTFLLRGTLVLMPRFDLEQVFAAIGEWKPTLLPGVPPIYQALSDSPQVRSHDLRSIRLCVSGAMRLPVDVAERFRSLSGATLVEGYGLTETSPCTHANPTVGPGRPGSIGLPLTGTRCKVVEQDDPSHEVPVGSPGELAISGPQVFLGYWGQPDSSDAFTEDGYLLTGDVAVMDADGWFTIVDRKKELIIAGGFNIYPSEVEQVIRELEGVADVAVVGIPDRYRGETVAAFVVRSPGSPGSPVSADDVTAHCAVALTAYKVPRSVEFRDELPRSAVGKVLRRQLVEQEVAGKPAPTKAAAKPPGVAPKAPTKAAPKASVKVAPKVFVTAPTKAAAKPPRAPRPRTPVPPPE